VTARRANESLERSLKSHRHAYAEASRLRAAGSVTQRTHRTIIEATFLASYSAFESFVEELYFQSLLGTSGLPDAVAKAAFADRATAEQILLGDRDFLKWLPWRSGVETLAARTLVRAGPFARLARADYERQVLEESRVLRNGVAHESGAAKARLNALVGHLPPRQRNVASYLTSTRQKVTRFDTHLDNFTAIGRALTAQDLSSAHAFLLPERPYKVDEVGEKGVYLCVRQSHVHRVSTVKQKLPACHACGSGTTQWRRKW
jgi:hypothetical protein